MISDIIR